MAKGSDGPETVGKYAVIQRKARTSGDLRCNGVNLGIPGGNRRWSCRLCFHWSAYVIFGNYN